MYHLRNLIHRTSVPSDPTTNMNSAEDFLLLLLHARTVAAANVILSYYPTDNSVELARRIVVNFVTIPDFKKSKGHDSDNCSSMDRSSEIRTQCEDGVHCYGIEFLSLSLIWHGFHDSIREGDGDRILRYWKFLLVIFKSSNKQNYAKEAGANIQQSSIVRAGKCVAAVHSVCDEFEKQTSFHSYSMHHPIPEFGKDLAAVIKALDEESVFIPTRKRQHASFNIKCGLMEIFTTD